MREHLRTAMACLALTPAVLHAQCPGCAVDAACFADPPYPTLCPAQPPEATAGEAYSADITFWLPSSFEDPGTGVNVDFLLMTITGVGGLPFGLALEPNEPSGVYHPQENAFGCARICGTPLSAGSYAITISIVAQVLVNGLTLNAPQQFSLPLTVLPGSGSNNGFTFTPSTGCGTATVLFSASIDGQGAPVTYAWDLGNGSTSAAATVEQTYAVPGAYPVTLQTTIGGFVLNTVNVTGVGDNWCGDVEEPSLFGACTGDPDIYFVLTDGAGNTWTSSSGDNSSTAVWTGLGRVLSAPPYSIAFFDEDVVSQDDDLGTFNVPQGTSGLLPFTLGNGTSGSLQIDLEPQQVFSDTDTVVVFPVPQPMLAYDTAAGTLCIADTGLVSITWFNDGDTVFTGDLACWGPDSAGTWWAAVNNGFGCLAITDTVVICPVIGIEQNGSVLFTTPGLDNYVWTWNGTPIPDSNSPFIVAEAGGLYGVTATNADGCVLEASFSLSTAGIAANITGSTPTARMLPDGGWTVNVAQGPCLLMLHDAMGRVIGRWTLAGRGPQEHRFPPDLLAPGLYHVVLSWAGSRSVLRMPVAR